MKAFWLLAVAGWLLLTLIACCAGFGPYIIVLTVVLAGVLVFATNF